MKYLILHIARCVFIDMPVENLYTWLALISIRYFDKASFFAVLVGMCILSWGH